MSLYEFFDPGDVFGFVLTVREGVIGTFGNPEGFRTWFRLIKRIDHVGGYKGIGVAMNEKHGIMAFFDLLQSRCLTKTPAITPFTKQTGGVHQRKRWQAELLFQLSCKLVPYAGVAAILNKAQVVDTIKHLLAREHHRGGSTH